MRFLVKLTRGNEVQYTVMSERQVEDLTWGRIAVGDYDGSLVCPVVPVDSCVEYPFEDALARWNRLVGRQAEK